MRILFAGSELAPFTSTASTSHLLAALPGALAARGHEVSVVLPGSLELRKSSQMEVRPTGVEFIVQLGAQRLPARILEGTAPNGVQIFLIEQDELFCRQEPAGDQGPDDPGEAPRSIFFSKAVVELARRFLPAPEIIHAHDWHTALVPVLIKDRRLPFRSVLSIQHPTEQGSFWAFDFGLTNLPGHFFSARGVEFFGQMNLLKGGILFADRIALPSPQQVQELQTPAHGAGLDAIFWENASKLRGILDGVDERVWNPSTDPLLPKNYSAADLTGKAACRSALLKQCGLQPDPHGPVFALATPLTEPASLEFFVPLLDRLLSADVRLIVAGPTETSVLRELGIARRRHAGRLAFLENADARETHLLLAGSDLFLLPTPREVEGLSARTALKYGVLPIFQTGLGLGESIRPADPADRAGHGFHFHRPASEALWDAITHALQHFGHRVGWQHRVDRALTADFSWARTAERYEGLYRDLLTGHS